jgi:hypothetical protein
MLFLFNITNQFLYIFGQTIKGLTPQETRCVCFGTEGVMNMAMFKGKKINIMENLNLHKRPKKCIVVVSRNVARQDKTKGCMKLAVGNMGREEEHLR